MYLRQAEARERAQKLLAELEVANRQLTEYSAQVEDLTIANERQRMARELHDTLSQGLAGLILQLEAVDAHLASSRPEKARQIVQQTMGKARETLADARRAIDDLRQDQPVGQDIEQAARQEIARFTGATGISCEFSANLTTPCPAALQDTVLRTLSEGLTNVTRHARASQVCIQLSTTADAVHVEIRDNGAGFDPAAVPAGHYGLLGLRERARLAGGTLEIESGGNGTVLRLWVPCTLYGG